MFKIFFDSHCAAEVRNKKFHISQLLFSSSAEHVHRSALVLKEDFFFLFRSTARMGCNNNLADDQLEAMITATDEEMQ